MSLIGKTPSTNLSNLIDKMTLWGQKYLSEYLFLMNKMTPKGRNPKFTNYITLTKRPEALKGVRQSIDKALRCSTTSALESSRCSLSAFAKS